MAKIIPVKNGTKREIISRKASVLFKQKGYNATSMRDIAEAIGVEAPSLYNHINSKKEILQEICFKTANLFIAQINKVEAGKLPVIEKLESIIRFHIYMMINEYEGLYISNHEWKHLEEPYLSNFKNQRKNYRARLAGIIEQGIEKKELKKIDSDVAVFAILSAIGGIENWQQSKRSIDAKSLEENMVVMLLQGIKK